MCLLAFATFCCGAGAVKPERPVGHEQLPGWATNAFLSLEYGLLVEVEGYFSKIGGESRSDILLATVAFDAETRVNEWLLGHVGLLWEQDSREADNLDEAYLAFGSTPDVPFYFVAGRFYQPVGNFETVFISDPPTLEMIEMNKVSAMAGFANGWIDLAAGAFRGDVSEGTGPGEGGDRTVSDFYASATCTPWAWLKFGAYWLSDLMEAYNYEEVGQEFALQPGYTRNGAAGAFANLHLGVFTFNAEYVSGLEAYEIDAGRYIPTALNVEGSVEFGGRYVAGLRYAASDDLYANYHSVLGAGEKFPRHSYGAVLSRTLGENALVAVEYLHGEGLDGGVGGDLATLKLALEF